MSYAVVTLNKHPDYARRLIESIREFDPGTDILVVADNHDTLFDGAQTLISHEPFCFSRNANMGIDHFPDRDIILVNDDVTLVEPTFQKLSKDSKHTRKTGILAPLVDGGVGNPYQSYARSAELWKGPKGTADMMEIGGMDPGGVPVCFVCVYLTRDMLEDVGPLDESFTGYGFEDNDYCLRARIKGWKTLITRSCHVKHGDGGVDLDRGKNWSKSFALEQEMPTNQELYNEKHAPKVRYVPPWS